MTPADAARQLVAAGVEAQRLAVELLRTLPETPAGRELGLSTAPAVAWPHQARIVREAVARYPQSFLFADEVGLGKTVEAALCLRQLLLDGRVRRALLLVPSAVLRQWQDELHARAALDVPRLVGERWVDRQGKTVGDRDVPLWERAPILLASTQAARRRERRDELLAAPPWDLVLVDEAHHARRRRTGAGDVGVLRAGGRPNRLLELLAGDGSGRSGDADSDDEGGWAADDRQPSARTVRRRGGLRARTRCLYLLSATPMQLDPLEIWDLLRLLGLGGRWGGRADDFLRAFAELARPPRERDHRFLLEMARDAVATCGLEARRAQLAAAAPPLVRRHLDALAEAVPADALDELPRLRDPREQAALDASIRALTPIAALAWRTTRDRLRAYRRAGLLRASIPERRVEIEWIELEGPQRVLYHRIEAHLSFFYQRFEARRAGLGFVMTVYRQRLTSSFAAVVKSLRSRRERLAERAASPESRSAEQAPVEQAPVEQAHREQTPIERQPIDQVDLFEMPPGQGPRRALGLEGPRPGDGELLERGVDAEEMRALDALVADLDALTRDPKLEQVANDLAVLLPERGNALVFTQYLDTMDALREAIAGLGLGDGTQLAAESIACWSGRGGERYVDGAWRPVAKATIRAAMALAPEAPGALRVLLSTEAAAEGLNLQSCGTLLNVDLPWNPMRVEQRIGRIDRIGQRHADVLVRSYLYRDTVEGEIHQRLSDRIDWFQRVVGRLQPILRQVAEVVERLAMAPPDRRGPRLEAEVARLRHELEHPIEVLDAGGEEATAVDQAPGALEAPSEALVAPEALEVLLLGCQDLAARLAADPTRRGVLEFDGVSATCRPEVFTADPDGLEFLSWGSARFASLLSSVPRPTASDVAAGVGVYRNAHPFPVSFVCAPPSDSSPAVPSDPAQPRRLAGLEDLVEVLEEAQAGAWSEADEATAASLFSRARGRRLAGERAFARRQHRGHRLALAARGRQVLEEAHDLIERGAADLVLDGAARVEALPDSLSISEREPVSFPELDALRERVEGVSGLDWQPPPARRGRRSRAAGRLAALRHEALRLTRRLDALATGADAAAGGGSAERGGVAIERRFYALAGARAPEPWVDALPYWGDLEDVAVRLLDSPGEDPVALDLDAATRPERGAWRRVDGALDRAVSPRPGLFVARVEQAALSSVVAPGDDVVFRLDASPPPAGTVVLAHHPDHSDPTLGDRLLLRRFQATRRSVVLESETERWVLDEPEGLRVLARFVSRLA